MSFHSQSEKNVVSFSKYKTSSIFKLLDNGQPTLLGKKDFLYSILIYSIFEYSHSFYYWSFLRFSLKTIKLHPKYALKNKDDKKIVQYALDKIYFLNITIIILCNDFERSPTNGSIRSLRWEILNYCMQQNIQKWSKNLQKLAFSFDKLQLSVLIFVEDTTYIYILVFHWKSFKYVFYIE